MYEPSVEAYFVCFLVGMLPCCETTHGAHHGCLLDSSGYPTGPLEYAASNKQKEIPRWYGQQALHYELHVGYSSAHVSRLVVFGCVCVGVLAEEMTRVPTPSKSSSAASLRFPPTCFIRAWPPLKMLGIEISLDTVQLVTFRYGGSKKCGLDKHYNFQRG